MFVLHAHTAPSAPTKMVKSSTVSSSAIYVSWGEVPCPQRNGEITGYIVGYNRSGTNRQVGEQVHVNSSAMHMTVVTDLDPLTEYIIKVAAVNGYGPGPFSDPVYATTSSMPKKKST